jgi:hypothetical protein
MDAICGRRRSRRRRATRRLGGRPPTRASARARGRPPASVAAAAEWPPPAALAIPALHRGNLQRPCAPPGVWTAGSSAAGTTHAAVAAPSPRPHSAVSARPGLKFVWQQRGECGSAARRSTLRASGTVPPPCCAPGPWALLYNLLALSQRLFVSPHPFSPTPYHPHACNHGVRKRPRCCAHTKLAACSAAADPILPAQYAGASTSLALVEKARARSFLGVSWGECKLLIIAGVGFLME